MTHANKAKRKTLGINDILSAISDMEFDSFIEPLKEALKSLFILKVHLWTAIPLNDLFEKLFQKLVELYIHLIQLLR